MAVPSQGLWSGTDDRVTKIVVMNRILSIINDCETKINFMAMQFTYFHFKLLYS